MIRLKTFAATKKMRNLLVILVIGICWQDILAKGLHSYVYSDHEERLQRLEAFMSTQDEIPATSGHEERLQRLEALMLSQYEYQGTSGHEERLQMLEAWNTSQDENRDSSSPHQRIIAESQEPEEPDYFGEWTEKVGGTSEDIRIVENLIVDLYDKVLSVLRRTENQHSKLLNAEESRTEASFVKPQFVLPFEY